MDYKLTTWADGFGIWYCRADFEFGVGNTCEAEKLKYRALDAAKRAIRRELKLREGEKLGRLGYEISDNELDSLNRLWSITVKERETNV